MGLQFYTDGGLLTTEELQALNKPTRIYFVVGESELPEMSCEVSFPTPEGEGDIETLVCPYVAPVNGVHYYSCTHKPLVYHYLTSDGGPSGPDDDTHNFTELTTEFENVTSEFRTPVIITGTIVDVELEGGFVGIQAGTDENPQNYIVVNIQDELAVHIGEEINITSSYTRSDIIGTEMWGEYLYVETYEIVEPILCVDTTNSVTIVNSKYVLNNGDTYGKFGLNIGKYTFAVSDDHPIYLVGNNTDQIDISSDVIRPMGQDGYTGNVVITVYEDFGTISYACSSHGPMGGTNNLVFDASCPMGEVETPTPEPILNHPFEELTTQYIESELEFRAPIMLTGTIVNVELEGGFIGIQVGTNENPEYYVPINIQDELANSVGKEILVTDSFLRTDWIGVEMPYPKKLIDTCLNTKPNMEGCDIVDVIYVLYMCNRMTDYRSKDIKEYFENLLSLIESHYFFGEGGFSYFLKKSQTHYYGVEISKGLNTPDLHGTLLLIWGISMISKVVDLPISNWNILKP